MAEHYDNGLTDAEKEAIYHRWQSARDEASYGDLMDWVEKAVIDKALARPASTQQVPMDEALLLLAVEALTCAASPDECESLQSTTVARIRQRLKIGGAG